MTNQEAIIDMMKNAAVGILRTVAQMNEEHDNETANLTEAQKTTKRIREIADIYHNPNEALSEVAHEVEAYGELGDKEREKLSNIMVECRCIATEIDSILKGVTA